MGLGLPYAAFPLFLHSKVYKLAYPCSGSMYQMQGEGGSLPQVCILKGTGLPVKNLGVFCLFDTKEITGNTTTPAPQLLTAVTYKPPLCQGETSRVLQATGL